MLVHIKKSLKYLFPEKITVEIFGKNARTVNTFCINSLKITYTPIIWSRHCLDASTAFLSGQCVYI